MKGTYNNSNRLQQLEQLDQARKLWSQSEFRLQFLRTQTGTTPLEPAEEELLLWMQQCQNRQ
jgi:hypothetical protein